MRELDLIRGEAQVKILLDLMRAVQADAEGGRKPTHVRTCEIAKGMIDAVYDKLGATP